MAKIDTSLNLHHDLLGVFLLAVNHESVNASTVSVELGHNPRYSRELLGVLSKELLQQVEIEGQDEWVIAEAMPADENFTTIEAAFTPVFNTWWSKHSGQEVPKEKAKEKKSAPRSVALNADPNRKCNCGCGEPVGKKSLYRPGHDARHAGAIAREVAKDLVNPDSYDWRMALEVLPTDALRAKAEAHARRLAGKGRKDQVKAGEKPAPAVTRELPPVQVGRWTYPAQEVNGTALRNTKRDGTGEWVKI